MRVATAVLAGVLFGCSTTGTPARSNDHPLTLRNKTTGPGGALIESQLFWNGSKRVTEQAHRRIIFDLETKTVTVIDKERKAYSVRTFDEVEQQREALNKRFEALSLEDRRKVGLDKPMILKATGKAGKIAGFPAAEYVIEGGPISGALWIAEALQPPLAWRDWEWVIANVESTGYAGRKLAEEIAKLKGFLVRMEVTIDIGSQSVPISSEIVHVIAKAPPPEVLVVPEGFQEVDAPIQSR
jgi:hypothetical protein